jgi:hypothetical protein
MLLENANRQPVFQLARALGQEERVILQHRSFHQFAPERPYDTFSPRMTDQMVSSERSCVLRTTGFNASTPQASIGRKS